MFRNIMIGLVEALIQEKKKKNPNEETKEIIHKLEEDIDFIIDDEMEALILEDLNES